MAQPPTDEEDKIKFISMVDQKPVKPNYLDLTAFKNFAKRELEQNRHKKRTEKHASKVSQSGKQ